MQFLARYLERAPLLALTKLTTDGAVVTYRSATGVVLWQGSTLDFLARLLLLPLSLVCGPPVRRGPRTLLPVSASTRSIPLICTACGGTMGIVKFHTDPKETAPLLKK